MYFAIEGVIGVGKTTLARMLQPSFESAMLLEVFEENPFLGDFYSDRERYAFQTQIFFLLSRYQQQRHGVSQFLSANKMLISDYTFEKDALFARINLKGDELEMYYRVHEALAEKTLPPDLIIYLRAETEVLMQRIARRDRPYERKMEHGYIQTLNQAYDDYFMRENRLPSPVLVIDTNARDFVKFPQDLEWIETRIRQRLHLPPFQPELPISTRSKTDR